MRLSSKIRSKIRKSSADESSAEELSGLRSPRFIFALIVLMYVVMSIRDMKSWNSQYFSDLVQNFDSSSVLPTTQLSWSAETPTETSVYDPIAYTPTENLPKDGDGRDNDTRPWLIIHVGPPKTATTTIQAGLAKYARMLARDDGFYFLGHNQTISKKDARIKVGGNVFRIYEIGPVMNFKKKEFLKDLKNLLKHGHHAILSAEQYTTFYNNPESLYKNGLFYTPDGTICTHTFNSNCTDNEERLFKFRVKIVVVYRHFFEWLASLYFQSQSHNLSPRFGKNVQIRGIVDFTEEYLEKLVQYDPEDNTTNIFTTSSFGEKMHGGIKMAEEGENETSHGSVWSYLKWSSWPGLYESVDILDFHHQPKPSHRVENNDAQHDFFADFVCQALPFASNTCHHLRNESTKTIHLRSGLAANKFLSSIDKNRIISGALKLPELHHKAFFEGNLHKRMEDWLHEAGIEGNDPESSGFKKYKRCLNPEYTLRLKKASWNFLLQMVLLQGEHTASRKDKNEPYYASLFQSSTPTNHLLLSSQFSTEKNDGDDSWVAPTKAAHDAAFDEHVSKLTYCEVNVEKLLESEGFVKSVFRIDKSRGKRR